VLEEERLERAEYPATIPESRAAFESAAMERRLDDLLGGD
jgi:hypothetical protein